MKLIDVNPETSHLTEAVGKCKVRVIFADNSHFDYPLSSSDNYSGDRANHPYIKNFINKLKINEEQKILILNEDGTERLGPITIPAGKLPVIRMRTRGGSSQGVNKFIIVGLVDKNSQTLHFLDRNGKSVLVKSPAASGPEGKVELLEEESVRL